MSRDVLEAAPEGQRAGRHLLMWAERGLAPRLIGAISRSDCLRVRAITDGCVRRHGIRRFHPFNVDGWRVAPVTAFVTVGISFDDEPTVNSQDELTVARFEAATRVEAVASASQKCGRIFLRRDRHGG
jgi:hypothetical protein